MTYNGLIVHVKVDENAAEDLGVELVEQIRASVAVEAQILMDRLISRALGEAS